MKRTICFILALIFALSSAACGKRSGQTASVTDAPSAAPTAVLTDAPTAVPTAAPTETPAAVPTAAPTETPTEAPSETPTAAPTEAPTEVPTAAPTKTPKPTAKPTNTPKPTAKPTDTPKPTAKPTNTPKPTSAPSVQPDQSIFDDAVFIGNSIFEGLYMFGVITHGTFLTKVGVNVISIYSDCPTGSDKTFFEMLEGKSYKKVILNLGMNEAGWPSQATFISKYGQLIEDIREMLPNAKFYIVALTPVTKTYSEGKGQENGINMTNINSLNDRIKSMCREHGAKYVPNPDALFDSEGYLPADASSDGVHMNLKYDRIWADHITLKVMGVI
jgi:hypothetical protein